MATTHLPGAITLPHPTVRATSVSFHPSGEYVAINQTVTDGLSIFEVDGVNFTPVELAENVPLGNHPYLGQFSPDGRFYATPTINNPSIAIYHIDDGDFVKVPIAQNLGATSTGVAFSPDGSRLVVTQIPTPYVQIYDVTPTGAEKSAVSISPLTSGISLGRSACFSADGERLIVGYNGSPGRIQIFDTSAANAYPSTATINAVSGSVHAVAISPDRSHIVYGSNTSPFIFLLEWNGTAYVSQSGRFNVAPASPTGHAFACRYSSDGAYLFVGAARANVYKRVGDAYEYQGNLPGYSGSPTSNDACRGGDISPDGSLLVAGADNPSYIYAWEGSLMFRPEVSGDLTFPTFSAEALVGSLEDKWSPPLGIGPAFVGVGVWDGSLDTFIPPPQLGGDLLFPSFSAEGAVGALPVFEGDLTFPAFTAFAASGEVVPGWRPAIPMGGTIVSVDFPDLAASGAQGPWIGYANLGFPSFSAESTVNVPIPVFAELSFAPFTAEGLTRHPIEAEAEWTFATFTAEAEVTVPDLPALGHVDFPPFSAEGEVAVPLAVFVETLLPKFTAEGEVIVPPAAMGDLSFPMRLRTDSQINVTTAVFGEPVFPKLGTDGTVFVEVLVDGAITFPTPYRADALVFVTVTAEGAATFPSGFSTDGFLQGPEMIWGEVVFPSPASSDGLLGVETLLEGSPLFPAFTAFGELHRPVTVDANLHLPALTAAADMRLGFNVTVEAVFPVFRAHVEDTSVSYTGMDSVTFGDSGAGFTPSASVRFGLDTTFTIG